MELWGFPDWLVRPICFESLLSTASMQMGLERELCLQVHLKKMCTVWLRLITHCFRSSLCYQRVDFDVSLRHKKHDNGSVLWSKENLFYAFMTTIRDLMFLHDLTKALFCCSEVLEMAVFSPAFLILLRSLSWYGLWSWDRGMALPSLSHRTPRESPTLATVNSLSDSRATRHVVPASMGRRRGGGGREEGKIYGNHMNVMAFHSWDISLQTSNVVSEYVRR